MEHNEVKYQRAVKRVKELKGFYRHLTLFLAVNVFFYLLKSGFLNTLLGASFKVYYFDRVNFNTTLWGIILAIHFLVLQRHRFSILKNWEQKQIKKYMDADESPTHKRK